MVAWFITLTGAYFAAKLSRSWWLAAIAGAAVGVVGGLIGGALVGVMGGSLFTPGEKVAHVIGSAFIQFFVGLIAALAFRAFTKRTEDRDEPKPSEPLAGCSNCGGYVPEDSFLCPNCNQPVGAGAV